MNKSTLNNRKGVGITSSLFAHNVSPKIVIIDNRRCQHVKASWWPSDWRFLSKRASQIFQFYDSLLRFKLKSPCTECIHTKNVSFLNFLEPFQSHDSHLVSERKAAKLREDWIPSSKKTIYDCYFYFLLPTYSWKKIRPFLLLTMPNFLPLVNISIQQWEETYRKVISLQNEFQSSCNSKVTNYFFHERVERKDVLQLNSWLFL